jgi:hypothetical protein
MAQFRQLNTGNIYTTVQNNGSTLPQEQIINFIGTQFTIADDPSNFRTNITFPDFLLLSGGTMLGNLILNADPTVALGAATKQYVDSLAAGLSPRTSCQVATTAALTVTYSNGASGVGATLTNAGVQAALSIDGIALSVGQRVLVKDQASTFQNGIYTVTNIGSGATNWVMTRATDYDTNGAAEVVQGSYTIVIEGTVNATNMFVETGADPFTIGTTPIVFSAFNSAANINVTAPLSKSGNTISLTTPLAATFGGTGVSNSNTITLGGNFVTSGAFATSGANALTLTTTGSTNVTLPTSGTLVNTAVTTLSSLSSIGTVTSGTWNADVIAGQFGGTGIANTGKTITLGGNFVTSGANALTLTTTGSTNVTLPTSGTLATTAQLPTFPISLTNGGTNASLTASNGGIFYSTATAGAILSGTATAGQILRSGASAAPTWSTATYPATTTVSQILYSSSANVVGGITTGNNGVLITSAGGVPSISSTIPSATQLNITSVGTVTSGTWNAGVIAGQFGGTGIANTGKTITLGGNFVTSGAFAATLTLTNTTTVTLPVSGTLLANTNNLSDVSSAATSRTNLGVDICFSQVVQQEFTASGTYTPTTGMVYCIVECLAGGGGGGGALGAGSGGAAAGGGGAGSYSRSVITAATIGASQVVTIGAAGAGGTAGNNAGSAGGDTSLGALVVAKGGSGGGGSANFTTLAISSAGGGGGGTTGTGEVVGAGASGSYGIVTNINGSASGTGGSTIYGGGGIGRSGAAAGNAGNGYGAGGGGALSTTASNAGGAGTAGLIVITEFIKRS